MKSFFYDVFARQVTATDGRTNTTFTAYNDLGQVSYTQSSTNKTYYFYNGLGQRVAVSNALGQVSHTAYNLRGQTIATWGTSYPVAYEFDTAGRMIALATTRSSAYANVNLNTMITSGDTLRDCNISALDITRWYYDETIGLLTNKVYAGGSGTVYTYIETGKIATRAWAKGKTTTYVYNNLGQLTNVAYSDSTPGITFTYDRLGRITSATSSASTCTFHYNGLTLDYETQDGNIIKRKQDVLGREIGYELYNPDDSGNPVKKIIYGYDSFNRLSTITSIIGTETNTFTYVYLPGTDLISGMTSDSGMQWSRSYESGRNLITAVSNSWNSTTISTFNYINDPLGRRSKRTDYFNTSTITNAFIYNQNSEVINATMNGDEYNCAFDPIGNRQISVYNALTNSYTANQLNQYTAINGDMSITPTHDVDGNLTWDGQEWSHSWDVENRLTSSAPNYWSMTNGATRIDYTYNHQNLRVEKIKKQLSDRDPGYPMTPGTNPGTWNPIKTSRYIWDGFNIAAEIIVDHITPATNINYYTWGLDLSGTLQGDGGVGGLLSDTKISSSETNTYFASTDANGNVTEYLDNTGSVKAHYEYNVFGQTTAKLGSTPNDFAFRFSTKYLEPETGLYYYVYRYYDPILGRWLSRDPIEESDGPELYLFLKNDGVNKIDLLGMWSATGDSKGKSRRIYKWEAGDTLKSLAEEVKLDYREVSKWMKSESFKKSGNGAPCKVSVPNVWIDADLLRGGSLYGRTVNFGGTIGSFVGTDLFTSSNFKVETARTVSELISVLNSNHGKLWGMTVFGHGSKSGILAQSGDLTRADENLKWVRQQRIISQVGSNNYKLAKIYMMQCYSAYVGIDEGGIHRDWNSKWNTKAVEFFGYNGMNTFMLDGGWKAWPWNWF